jgi:hypothetical protein
MSLCKTLCSALGMPGDARGMPGGCDARGMPGGRPGDAQGDLKKTFF